MPPIITLTTDFGTQDGYVGAMKGRILSICNDAALVDLSHEIPPQDIRAAAWCLARAAAEFPAGSIHVTVVDPGVGSRRHALLVGAAGQWFVGPDNGVFDRILERLPLERALRIHRRTRWWHAHTSFDGLAVFAPVAAHLARGLAPSSIGRATSIEPRLRSAPALREGGRVLGRIELFDRFGNAITTIPAELVDPGIVARCRGIEFPLRDHYAAAAADQPLALIDSDQRLELALRDGCARAAFGLERGDEVELEPAEPNRRS